jgi:hypothetical protein
VRSVGGQNKTEGRGATVIVVGAGVSGCACAATLAAAGIRVLVLSKALDTVGLPAYGPDLVSLPGGLGRVWAVLSSLPTPLREVWSGAAAIARRTWQESAAEDHAAALAVSSEPMPQSVKGDTSVGDDGFVNVDRRVLSIETKRLLETMPGLQFRQGLVDDLRTVGGGACDQGQRVAVETVFGEVFEADAVVLAVGLSMGGEVILGEDRLPGGRYGEMPSDGLLQAMRRLGAEFDRVELEVGGRFPRSDQAFAREPEEGRGGDESGESTGRQPTGRRPAGERPTGEQSSAQPSSERRSAEQVRAADRCSEERASGKWEDFGSCLDGPEEPTTGAAGKGRVDEQGRGAGAPASLRVVPVGFCRLGASGEAKTASRRQDASAVRDGGVHRDWPADYPAAPHQDHSLRLWWGAAWEVAASGADVRKADAHGIEGVAEHPGGLASARAKGSVVGLTERTGGQDAVAAPVSEGESDQVLAEGSRGWPAGRPSVVPPRTQQGQAPSLRPSEWCELGEARLIPAVSPDGLATGEVYVAPELMRALGGGDSSAETRESAAPFTCGRSWEVLPVPGRWETPGPQEMASRLGYLVRGLVIRAAEDGRVLAHGVPIGPVWVAGRAGGAADHLESLASGVRVAQSVLTHVSERGGRASGNA